MHPLAFITDRPITSPYIDDRGFIAEEKTLRLVRSDANLHVNPSSMEKGNISRRFQMPTVSWQERQKDRSHEFRPRVETFLSKTDPLRDLLEDFRRERNFGVGNLQQPQAVLSSMTRREREGLASALISSHEHAQVQSSLGEILNATELLNDRSITSATFEEQAEWPNESKQRLDSRSERNDENNEKIIEPAEIRKMKLKQMRDFQMRRADLLRKERQENVEKRKHLAKDLEDRTRARQLFLKSQWQERKQITEALREVKAQAKLKEIRQLKKQSKFVRGLKKSRQIERKSPFRPHSQPEMEFILLESKVCEGPAHQTVKPGGGDFRAKLFDSKLVLGGGFARNAPRFLTSPFSASF